MLFVFFVFLEGRVLGITRYIPCYPTSFPGPYRRDRTADPAVRRTQPSQRTLVLSQVPGLVYFACLQRSGPVWQRPNSFGDRFACRASDALCISRVKWFTE
ncbi:hypothetical protein LY76DRAFT_3479 [Colletotrichum caudatum]|nr:hypothetical protein LY76DRAFT_3479 [Colletotrichum caudatum]